MRLGAVAIMLVSTALLAGCSGPRGTPEPAVDAGQATLHGVVVTGAIVPIAGASVVVVPGNLTNSTDAKGEFTFRSLAPGAYRIEVQARGYAANSVDVQLIAGANPLVNVVLAAVANDVPYYEVEHFNGYVECSYAQNFGGVVGGDFSCLGITDLVLGVKVDSDANTFPLRINAGGFKGLLFEMVWDAQSTGPNYAGYIRDAVPVGQAGGLGLEKQYWADSGLSPLRAWVLQGVENTNAYEGDVFHPDPSVGADYEVLIGGVTDESKPVDVAVTLEQHLDIFITKFYNALGDPSYTVLGA